MQVYNLITQQLFPESSFCHWHHKLFKYYFKNENALDENDLLPFTQKGETEEQKRSFGKKFLPFIVH